MILKDHQNEAVSWTENFLPGETMAKNVRSSYHEEQKRVPNLTLWNNLIFTLSKDVIHTPDMQHYLTKLCID